MNTKIRVDACYLNENADLNEILKTVSKTYEQTGILVMEKQPKIHYHAYIESDVTLPTLRKKLNEHLVSHGNEAKSVSNSHHDWDVYKGYLFKYDDTSVIHIGTKYDKNQLKEAYENHTKKVDDNLSDMPNSVIVQIEYYLKDKQWETLQELGEYIVDYMNERKKLLDKHYIGKLVTTMYVRSGKGKKKFVSDTIYTETCYADQHDLETGRIERCKFCLHT